MFVTLFAIACLDASVPGTCVNVEVDASLTIGECLGIHGQNVARDYLAQHPTYARPNWHAAGWRCRIGNKEPWKEGEA